MRALNRTLFALLATASTLSLAGCLGTDYPPIPPALIDESASGTGYVAMRGTTFEDLVAPAGFAGGTAVIGAGTDNAVFTAFTNSGSGAYGFLLDLPADSVPSGAGSAAIINLNGGFTSLAAGGVFPAGTLQATIPTYPSAAVNSDGTLIGSPSATGSIQVDKFGTSQALQDSEYGIWAENGTTAGLSTTAATNAGVFAIGIPTTIMPTTGTAEYVGGAAGFATNATTGGQFAGTAVLNASFSVGGGTISGFITGPGDTGYTLGGATPIPYSTAGSSTVGTMNAINLGAGSIAGNTFSGSSATAIGTGLTSAGNIAIDNATTGSYAGQFNGINATIPPEVAGTFKLSSGSGAGATNVIGSFGAKQQ